MISEKIYIASSWRNPYYEDVLTELRKHFECYDFKQPYSGGPKPPPGVLPNGFGWKDADPNFTPKHPKALTIFREMLGTPVAQTSFSVDFGAMKWADTCVLVLPSGRSAHIEAGWMAGSGRRLIVYMPPHLSRCVQCGGDGREGQYDHLICDKCGGDGNVLAWNFEPELMYLVGGDRDLVCFSMEEVLHRLRKPVAPVTPWSAITSLGVTREAILWDPQAQREYRVRTEYPYPLPMEKIFEQPT